LVAIAFFGIACIEVCRNKTTLPFFNNSNANRTIGLVFLLVITLNVTFYFKAFMSRRFIIHNAQTQFINEKIWKNKVVLGAWSSSLFWGTGAITIPVWKNYFNDKAIIETLHPDAVVSETDQADSSQAYDHSGTILPNIPNYTLHIKIWDINIYKMNSTTYSME
jgi:hypothetical protein